MINIYIFNQTQQYFIIELSGDKFQSLDHHQPIIT
jgi:hypothetical protein